MEKLILNLKKEKSRRKTFQFQMDSDIEKKLDRIWKQFRDEYPSKSDIMRYLIDEAYQQNVEK
ncbi:MAG: hypothetical protein NTW25_00565 [Candidatus Kapabacteria bacterium]|nr:hypothetical protein [Candidatus Kapabacteria bacterium]